jgi:hypothetical protein
MDGLSRTIRPRHVVADTDRHGNMRWYFRVSGQRKIRLPDSGPGTKEFAEAEGKLIAAICDAVGQCTAIKPVPPSPWVTSPTENKRAASES